MPWTTVSAISTTEVFYPCTGWGPAANIDRARTTWELISKNGNLSVQPAFQLCNVINSVDAVTGIGDAQTDDGVSFGDSFDDVGTTAASKQLIRWGFIAKLTTGSTLATGRVSGVIDYTTRS